MAAGGSKKGAREQRERARLYQARAQLNEAQQRRRVRDNVLGGVVGGVLILAAIGAQSAYFTVGPGAPAPAPTRSATPTATPTAPSAAPTGGPAGGTPGPVAPTPGPSTAG